MLNSLGTYAKIGFTAGVARNQGDESRARFETDYFRRMRALEKAGDRSAARDAFDRGYKNARTTKASVVPRIYG